MHYLLFACLALSAFASPLGENHPFAQCATCHGQQGEGNEELRAPRLAGQDVVYLRNQIEAFRQGWRDGTEQAQTMAAIVKTLSPEQISAAIDYVADLTPPEKRDRVFGLRLNGEHLYRRNCAICHGDRAEGSEYHMPVLNMQHGWYLREQLTHFREGKRGHHSADKSGSTMAFYARLLKDDREVRDVSAYLSALRKPPADTQ
jgi:cytochrome c oxidase subunit 2